MAVATGAWAGDGVTLAAVLGATVPGIAVLMLTTTFPAEVAAGGGVTASSAETGVTTVPIGPSVGGTRSVTTEMGLGAHPALRLAMASAITAA